MARKPQQTRAKATVDAIVQAGLELVSEHGVGFLSTAKIARRAGVSVGSLYEYFDNKEQIIHAATGRIATEAIATIQPWGPELIALPPRMAVYELLTRMRAFVERDEGLYLNYIRNVMASGQPLELDSMKIALRDLGLRYVMAQPQMLKVENLQAKLYVMITGGIVSYLSFLADPAPGFSFDDLANALSDMVAANAR